MTAHLVLGGARSGKSAHAERLVAPGESPVAYVATGTVTDAEMAERVAEHRRRRPAGWRVHETTDLAGVMAGVDPWTAVLIDDLEGWLTARMDAHGLLTDAEVAALGPAGAAATDAIVEEADAWWTTAGTRPGPTVCVAGQPGLGVTPLGAATRRYVDLHGRVVARLSERAGAATLVVAGRALPLPAAVPTVPRGGRSGDHDAAAGREDLRDHGDHQVPPGTLDLAVNVCEGPPRWLRDRLAGHLDALDAYPDDTGARSALAARHARDPDEIVPLAGAAEGLWLLPQVLRPRLAACVHPGFTEGEAALAAAGVPVTRVFRDPDDDWRLDPARVPDEADLVLLGRPDNPTGVVDAAATVAALARPGRTVVVDEAFAEFLPDAGGLASQPGQPTVVAVRSLTKLWGLAGLRVGYLVAPARLARRLAAARQPWAVGHLALQALIALAGAEDERRARARAVAGDREHLLDRLRRLPGITAWDAAANFVLLRAPRDDLRRRLLDEGIAVRRCATFPGLDDHHLRVAVRSPQVSDRLVDALSRVLHLDAHA